MKESSSLVLNGGVIPKTIFVLCFVLIAFWGRLYSQVGETFSSTFEQATTDHQKDVILFQNGLWKFAFEDDHKSFVVSDSASDPYQFAHLQDGRRVVIYSVGNWRFLEGEQSKEATTTVPSPNTTPVGNIQGTQKATNSSSSYNHTPSGQSRQCSGTTQKGARCLRMTTSSNGRCYQHGG